VALTVAACGAANSSKTEILRLRSANPLTSNIYVKVIGPAGAVNYVVDRMKAAAFKTDEVGVFLPPSESSRPHCSFAHAIRSGDAPDLQRWRGEKVRLAVYGSAGLFCHLLRSSIYLAGT
jgi:hypothetical protein